MKALTRDFEVEALLGGGGSARVYRVRRRRDQRLFALKLLRNDQDPDFVRRVERELEALSRIRHPAFVGFHGCPLLGPDCAALLLDLVEGETLKARVAREGALGLPLVWSLLVQLSGVLAAFHREGLVHRDLAPGNVMLRPDGTFVLVDPGLVRPLAGPSFTDPAVLPGTPGFIAPELLDGHPPGPPADIFGLGMLALYAATGTLPWGQGSPALVLVAQAEKPAQDCLGTLPQALRPLLARMLATAPEERLQDGEELEQMLAEGGAGQTKPRLQGADPAEGAG
jgi:serine/threonine-protein kinase